jgi:RNA polymerase sigma-70 factor (ECF subfamily)
MDAMNQRARQADEDDACMARLAGGDQSALAALYDRHAPIMLGVATALLSDRAEAEDVLHDVFVEAWKRAADFDAARGTVRAWLLVRVRSRCLDRLKAPRHARRADLDDAGLDRQAAPATDPLLRYTRASVRSALETLSPDHRVVIELAYFHGLSTGDIAARLQVPAGTVKSRLFAAREKLAIALVAHAPGDAP